MYQAPQFSMPLHLFNCYASYKQATNEVIRWLTRNSESGIERANLSSVRELRHLADHVILNGIEIPGRLIQMFRGAIQARKRLANFYRHSCGESCTESIKSHQFFNDEFERLLGDLDRYHTQRRCSFSALVITPPRTPVEGSPRALGKDSPWALVEGSPRAHVVDSSRHDVPHANPFQCLECHADDLARERTVHSPPPHDYTSFSSVGPAENREVRGPSIEDDPLEEIATLQGYLFQLDHLTLTAKKSYSDCASGRIPPVVAALTTNCAYQCAKSLSTTLLDYSLKDPAELKQRHTSLLRDLCVQTESPGGSAGQKSSSNLQTLSLGHLQLIWEELIAFRETSRSQGETCCRPHCLQCGSISGQPCYENPMEFFSTKHADQTGAGRENLDRAFYRSIFRALKDQAQRSAALELHSLFDKSLVKDFASFLADGYPASAVQSNSHDICFGLYLVMETYRSFCQTDNAGKGASSIGVDSKRGCDGPLGRTARLHALKLSSAFCATTKSLLGSSDAPCGCVEIRGSTILSQLVESANVFNHFVRAVHFDLLHQAPWISGLQAADNLARVSDSGSILWHYGYFVGTVLHVYNALVQSKLLEPSTMPLLEALCEIYADTVFLGKRSSTNFLSCWKRWTGARIMSKHPHGQRQRPLDGKWNLCAVHDSSHGGNTANRSFAPTKVSLFAQLVGGKSVLDDEVTTCVCLDRSMSRKYQPKDLRLAKSLIENDGPLAMYVEKVQAALEKEFQGSTVPLARIDYFAVYRACMRAMRRTSDANHDEDPGYICKCTAEMCLRECEVYVKSCATRQGRRRSQSVSRKSCESCLEALQEEFGEDVADRFLWDVSLNPPK